MFLRTCVLGEFKIVCKNEHRGHLFRGFETILSAGEKRVEKDGFFCIRQHFTSPPTPLKVIKTAYFEAIHMFVYYLFKSLGISQLPYDLNIPARLIFSIQNGKLF